MLTSDAYSKFPLFAWNRSYFEMVKEELKEYDLTFRGAYEISEYYMSVSGGGSSPSVHPSVAYSKRSIAVRHCASACSIARMAPSRIGL